MRINSIFFNLNTLLIDLKSIIKKNQRRVSILTQVKIIEVYNFELCTVKFKNISK